MKVNGRWQWCCKINQRCDFAFLLNPWISFLCNLKLLYYSVKKKTPSSHRSRKKTSQNHVRLQITSKTKRWLNWKQKHQATFENINTVPITKWQPNGQQRRCATRELKMRFILLLNFHHCSLKNRTSLVCVLNLFVLSKKDLELNAVSRTVLKKLFLKISSPKLSLYYLHQMKLFKAVLNVKSEMFSGSQRISHSL